MLRVDTIKIMLEHMATVEQAENKTLAINTAAAQLLQHRLNPAEVFNYGMLYLGEIALLM